MSDLEACRGKAVVVQPGDGPSYWQPVPANGHADPVLVPADTGYGGLSMGYQNIAPESRIRAHSHRDQVELQICFSGRGHVEVNGERHELVPGTACFLGPDVVHEIFNDGEDDLVQLWVIGPAGLEDFFRSIGRPRHEGEIAPTPFERPGDVAAVERDLGFGSTKTE
jgi:quercetin dioxygenase-like cupin family protein